MSCHGRKRAGVIDHLLTLPLLEARGADWREALLCFRVNAGKFGLAADVRVFHPGSAMVVGSVVYPQPVDVGWQTLRSWKKQPFVWNSKGKHDPERRNKDPDDESMESTIGLRLGASPLFSVAVETRSSLQKMQSGLEIILWL